MINERHLPNAPIKEALIDIQVALPDDFQPKKLDSKYESIKDEYPVRSAIQQQIIGLHQEENKPSRMTVDHGLAGFRYTSENKKRVVQFRHDGFTFSRLAPYDTWEEMLGSAKELWNIFVEVAMPISISRIATRYINILELPLGRDFKDFLSAPPAVPEGVNQELVGFLTRVEFRDQDNDARCILTQALENVVKDSAPVVLDIDTFISKTYEIDSEEMWSDFDRLREFKNKVFFASITENSEELFK